MSEISHIADAAEKKAGLGHIQSYRGALSRNASRLLERMIEHAIDRYKTGEQTHIMHFNEVVASFGLSMTNHREYVREKVKELESLNVVEWDFLGEESRLLESIKEISREDIDNVIKRPSFKSIVETEHFENLDIERVNLKNNNKTHTRAYRKIVDEMLDLLFPLFVGNTSMFEAIDIHKNKVSYSFNRHIIDLLINPSVYGIYDRTVNFMFQSPYSMRLYQNACVYKHLGYTSWLDLDQAKKLFGVEQIINKQGDPEFKHRQYSQFKRNVINYALGECNKFHDQGRIPFNVSLEEDRSITPRKSVDRIRFKISFKQPEGISEETGPVLGVNSLLDEIRPDVSTTEMKIVVDKMVQFGVKREAAIEDVEFACSKHGAKFSGLMKNVQYCIDQNEKRRQRGKQLVRPGYVRNAIRDGYEPYHEVAKPLDPPPASREKPKEIEANNEDKREFVDRVLAFSEIVLENKDGQYTSLIEKLCSSNALLRQLVLKDSASAKDIADRLLSLPNEPFMKITGMHKDYQKPQLMDYLG